MGIVESSSVVEPTEDKAGDPPLPSAARSGTRPPQFERRLPNTRQSRPPKRRGEAAELAFMNKAIAEGFAIAKPWGDSERYDFILDNGRRLWRVQVRSTETEWQYGIFTIRTHAKVKGKTMTLTSKDVDVIAAYIVPRNIWYIVPIEEATTKTLCLNPGKSTRDARWEEFREGWSYLRAPDVGQIL